MPWEDSPLLASPPRALGSAADDSQGFDQTPLPRLASPEPLDPAWSAAQPWQASPGIDLDPPAAADYRVEGSRPELPPWPTSASVKSSSDIGQHRKLVEGHRFQQHSAAELSYAEQEEEIARFLGCLEEEEQQADERTEISAAAATCAPLDSAAGSSGFAMSSSSASALGFLDAAGMIEQRMQRAHGSPSDAACLNYSDRQDSPFLSDEVVLESCTICGRRFRADRLRKHEDVCRRVKVEPRRPVFESRSQRCSDLQERWWLKEQILRNTTATPPLGANMPSPASASRPRQSLRATSAAQPRPPGKFHSPAAAHSLSTPPHRRANSSSPPEAPVRQRSSGLAATTASSTRPTGVFSASRSCSVPARVGKKQESTGKKLGSTDTTSPWRHRQASGTSFVRPGLDGDVYSHERRSHRGENKSCSRGSAVERPVADHRLHTVGGHEVQHIQHDVSRKSAHDIDLQTPPPKRSEQSVPQDSPNVTRLDAQMSAEKTAHIEKMKTDVAPRRIDLGCASQEFNRSHPSGARSRSPCSSHQKLEMGSPEAGERSGNTNPMGLDLKARASSWSSGSRSSRYEQWSSSVQISSQDPHCHTLADLADEVAMLHDFQIGKAPLPRAPPLPNLDATAIAGQDLTNHGREAESASPLRFSDPEVLGTMMADVKLLGAHVDHLINVQQRLLGKAPSPFDSVDARATAAASAVRNVWPSEPYDPERYSAYAETRPVPPIGATKELLAQEAVNSDSLRLQLQQRWLSTESDTAELHSAVDSLEKRSALFQHRIRECAQHIAERRCDSKGLGPS